MPREVQELLAEINHEIGSACRSPFGLQ